MGPEGVFMGKIRVVVADDHPLIRQGIVSTVCLESDLGVVDQAADGEAAVASCRENHPDILILDVGMPGPGSSTVVKSIQQVSPDTKVLVLTAYDDDIYIRQLLKVGVAGYLLKDEGVENLVRAIRSIHGGATWFSQTVTEKFVRWQYGPQAEQAADLTAREKEVLKLISEGLDNSQIAEQLALAEQTIRNYSSSIYDKLDVNSRAQAMIWARDNL